ncbi:hypothetical protein SARC_09149 [Sphaeroforma arctica JP610]|uniref:Uncharacterized protein n=1 Tax=Sphaeroforma arctica JP610 TaxID=667725 RepID=A0A0L0FNL2_9EUKA|nr:hypothetical protein SARC_09149 [Sphaeroforma arctica JP610]KNC78415.1 hypothetical protein SARC_09149 [Sphaeroforma arctica JP610]|eukprot:XP_014152317.1 hypothetical protein SARC_09149 [Sphaeroforma arctica JP610]
MGVGRGGMVGVGSGRGSGRGGTTARSGIGVGSGGIGVGGGCPGAGVEGRAEVVDLAAENPKPHGGAYLCLGYVVEAFVYFKCNDTTRTRMRVRSGRLSMPYTMRSEQFGILGRGTIPKGVSECFGEAPENKGHTSIK